MKRQLQGPENHPLRDLSVVWREDGGVQLTSQMGRALQIVNANLRNRRCPFVHIRIDPKEAR